MNASPAMMYEPWIRVMLMGQALLTTLSMNTMKWPRNYSGETQNRARRAAAQIERIVMFLAGLAFFFSFTGVGGGAATATGAAETCTGGGGQSSSPARETVMP